MINNGVSWEFSDYMFWLLYFKLKMKNNRITLIYFPGEIMYLKYFCLLWLRFEWCQNFEYIKIGLIGILVTKWRSNKKKLVLCLCHYQWKPNIWAKPFFVIKKKKIRQMVLILNELRLVLYHISDIYYLYSFLI